MLQSLASVLTVNSLLLCLVDIVVQLQGLRQGANVLVSSTSVGILKLHDDGDNLNNLKVP
jgi:hypothetical protein